MARDDIRPAQYMGQASLKTQGFRLNASETFLRGEPVSLNADGELTEAADDPVDGDLLGLALEDGDTSNATGLSQGGMRMGQYTDAGLPQTGDIILVGIPSYLQTFETSNFSTNGSAFGNAAPALANLGDRAGLSLISGSWGVDTNVTNFVARISDVLSRNGISLQFDRQATGRTVVFHMSATQLNTFGNLDDAIA